MRHDSRLGGGAFLGDVVFGKFCLEVLLRRTERLVPTKKCSRYHKQLLVGPQVGESGCESCKIGNSVWTLPLSLGDV